MSATSGTGLLHAGTPPAAPAATATPDAAGRTARAALAVVAGLTLAGCVMRVLVARQSLFADELSTYWISADHSLVGVLRLLYSSGPIQHAEITPPLLFVLAWLSTRLGHTALLLRLPSLVAGTATIPLVHAVGRRTVGPRAALAATAFTALAPFMIFYSSEARAYALMIALVLGSTLALLRALDEGRRVWWVLYAVCACAAFYTHYTSAFALAAQLAWVLWVDPGARRAALSATAGAAIGVIPWIPGMIADLDSPTLKILGALSPFTPAAVRFSFTHWAVGYPVALAIPLRDVPGPPALVLFALAGLVALAGLGARLRTSVAQRGWRASAAAVDRRVVLVLALALAAPVGECLASAAGHQLLDVRDLASAWPYAALACAAALTAAGARAGLLALALATAAFGLGGARLLGSRYQRPDYAAAAAYVDSHARPGDVVIDETGALSPGPLTGLDVTLKRRLPVFRAQTPAERTHPFGFSDPIVSQPAAIARAVTAAGTHRVFLVTNAFATGVAALAAKIDTTGGGFPRGWRVVAGGAWPGSGGTLVSVYAPPVPRARH
jgi:4-amino-4-deoxy-L-arabinose transferase-like glycosyltransferase